MTETGKAYGGALFLLAREEGQEQTILEHLTGVCALLDENPDFIRLMEAPTLNRQKRIDILSETFGGRVHEYLHNFMCILVENGTFRQLPDCLEEYRRRYDLLHGIIRVTAVTAVPMDETQLAALREKLAAQTGRQVELSTRVDPSTMGGVVLEMEGKRIDGSVRARLEAIRSELLSVKA